MPKKRSPYVAGYDRAGNEVIRYTSAARNRWDTDGYVMLKRPNNWAAEAQCKDVKMPPVKSVEFAVRVVIGIALFALTFIVMAAAHH